MVHAHTVEGASEVANPLGILPTDLGSIQAGRRLIGVALSARSVYVTLRTVGMNGTTFASHRRNPEL